MSGESGSTRPVNNESGPVITLKSGEDPRVLKLDRCILTKHSKYFEGSTSFDSTEICFDEKIIPFEILELLVEFMLSEEALNPTMDNIERLFYAADYLQMDGALKVLMDFLHADMATKHIVNIEKRVLLMYLRVYRIVARYAKLHNYEYLKKNYQYYSNRHYDRTCDVSMPFFLAVNFKRIRNEKPVLDLAYDDLVPILDSIHLDISEEDVIKIIKKWINYEFDDRKIHFENLLRCVRYEGPFDMNWVTEQVSCACNTDCKCLSSQDFLISLYAVKNYFRATIPDLPKQNERCRRNWC